MLKNNGWWIDGSDLDSKRLKDGLRVDKNNGDKYKRIIILRVILIKEKKFIENLNCSLEIKLEK